MLSGSDRLQNRNWIYDSCNIADLFQLFVLYGMIRKLSFDVYLPIQMQSLNDWKLMGSMLEEYDKFGIRSIFPQFYDWDLTMYQMHFDDKIGTADSFLSFVLYDMIHML